jgi:NADH-quinone oxidoreductase subunit M
MSFDDAQGYLVLSTIAIPLLAALILVLLPGERKMESRYLSLIAGALVLGLSIYIFAAYQVDSSTFQMHLRWAWVENTAFLGKNGITFYLGVDGISAPLGLLNGIVAFSGALVAWKIDYRPKQFFILYWIFIAGVFGTFFSLDLFFWFLFYELATMPLYLLIGVWGSVRKEYGAIKLVMMLFGGSSLLWIAIFAVVHDAGLGTFDLTALWNAGQSGVFSPTFQKVFFPMFVIGCGFHAALWPFHTWSPDGHGSAPTTVSMLAAGVLMKFGGFGIIRLGIQLLPAGAAFWMPGLMVLGVIGAVYGAVAALTQKDYKLLSGYSSISHMGYVMMGLAAMNQIGITGSVMQMFSHGVMTALFFLLIGTLYDQAHTRNLPEFGGIARKMPIWAIFFTIAGFTGVGLPGLSGFIAEFHIFVGVFRSYPIFGALAILAAAFAAGYIFRMFATVFYGPFNPRWEKLKDISPVEGVAATLLVLAIIAMGVYWSPFTDRIGPTVALLPGLTH